MTSTKKSAIELSKGHDCSQICTKCRAGEVYIPRLISSKNCVFLPRPLQSDSDSLQQISKQKESQFSKSTTFKDILNDPEINSAATSAVDLTVYQKTIMDHNTQPTFYKTKRSSSASNDSFHERDRFIARFESFNPPNPKATDQPIIGEEGSPEWEDISTKTKKLNITHLPSAVVSDVEEESLEIKDNVQLSPLDQNSALFANYVRCPVPKEMNILDVRIVSSNQLTQIFSWYFNTPLPPTSHMFPWLHGLHPENFAQRTFFGYSSIQSKQNPANEIIEDYSRPALARFIVCVETNIASSKHKPRVLRNSVLVSEILQRIEFARSEVESIVRMIITQSFSNEELLSMDVAELTDCLTMDCVKTGYLPVLINSDPQRGISLRNFSIQVNKAAACADFIVYCTEQAHESKTCNCRAFARLLKVAQISQDPRKVARLNVFVFEYNEESENFSSELWTVRGDTTIFSGVDAKKKTQLDFHNSTQIISDTFNHWDADFQLKEKLETTVMTAATKLCLNVWSGNIWDYQTMMQNLKGHSMFVDNIHIEIVPLEAGRDNYCDPEKSLLTRKFTTSANINLISALPPPRSNWKLFIHCHGDARFPSRNLLSELLFKYTITSRIAADVDDLHCLDFPSSGSIGLGDCRQENLMSIVNTCKLLYLYSSSVAPSSLASLIYCSDGYTESSLLVLCFLMYAKDIPLEKAMLNIHLEYGRPYYVFSTDVQVLRKLEVLLRKYSPARLNESIIWQHYETILQEEISDILLKPKRKGSTIGNAIPRRFRLGYIATESSSESSDHSDTECEGKGDAQGCDFEKCWVEELDGSLPSKILPYIYLGSLKHANNLAVLSKLGITKVISVGETLQWLNDDKFKSENEFTMGELCDGKIEMINIRPKGQHPSPQQGSPVSTVLKLKNLQDDGIDGLMGSLPWTLGYIDQEYKISRGMTKFLIHCRVGVSRSATVVIAEVMSRLGLNLPQAYLYVRVRRLNIVIQPNLRFMYELFKWEEKEREEAKLKSITENISATGELRVIDWFVFCQEIKKLNMPLGPT